MLEVLVLSIQVRLAMVLVQYSVRTLPLVAEVQVTLRLLAEHKTDAMVAPVVVAVRAVLVVQVTAHQLLQRKEPMASLVAQDTVGVVVEPALQGLAVPVHQPQVMVVTVQQQPSLAPVRQQRILLAKLVAVVFIFPGS